MIWPTLDHIYGLCTQLTLTLFVFKVKDNTGELRPCSWEEAIVTVAKVMDSTPGDKIGAVVGGMADAEVQLVLDLII